MEKIPQKQLDFIPERDLIKELPKDNEGYTQSFSRQQTQEIKHFFNEYGFVVIQNALNEQQIKDQISDIWDYIEQRKFTFNMDNSKKKVKRNDPETWYSNFGWDYSMASEGIIGMPPVFTKTALEIRQNEVVFQIGNLLQNTENTIISHDRYGVFRPTNLKVKNPDGTKYWETIKNIHMDMNPWGYFNENNQQCIQTQENYNNWKYNPQFVEEFNKTGHFSIPQIKLQAQFNLLDNKKENGGFVIVPGMHKYMKTYANITRDTLGKKFGETQDFNVLHVEKYNSVMQQDPTGIHKFAQRITSRSGSLIIWNQLCPHGSAPNRSEELRMAHFFKISNLDNIDEEGQIIRAKLIMQQIQKSKCEVTKIGKKLFGLEILQKEKIVPENSIQELDEFQQRLDNL